MARIIQSRNNPTLPISAAIAHGKLPAQPEMYLEIANNKMAKALTLCEQHMALYPALKKEFAQYKVPHDSYKAATIALCFLATELNARGGNLTSNALGMLKNFIQVSGLHKDTTRGLNLADSCLKAISAIETNGIVHRTATQDVIEIRRALLKATENPERYDRVVEKLQAKYPWASGQRIPAMQAWVGSIFPNKCLEQYIPNKKQRAEAIPEFLRHARAAIFNQRSFEYRQSDISLSGRSMGINPNDLRRALDQFAVKFSKAE